MKSAIKISSGKGIFRRLDWVTTVVPFLCVSILCLFFMMAPEKSAHILDSIRFFLGDQMSSYYLILGLGALICSLYMAFSPFGKIRLGNLEKPQYPFFQWIHDVYRRSCGGYFVLFPV